jgi:NAD(P)-dependent dehydrogenase (short-subunit alcohol dehydrogenase family)
MDLDLTGKRVLVTGGSKGIGFACARLFLEEGAKVAIVSRSQANIDAALAKLGGAIGVAADLIDAAQAAAMVERVERELGAIDILVNSAGAAKRAAPDDLTPPFWRAAMDAKYFSYINVMDPVVKLMAKRGSGVIVNIIGHGGKVATSEHLAGGSANAALMLATVGLAKAYARQGVRVLGLNPGLTETTRVQEALEVTARSRGISVEEAKALGTSRIPLGRFASPEDLANMTVFLASDRASYVTGVNIGMDGASTSVVV